MGKTYSETISFKGEFNPRDILNGIKQIQSALESSASSKGKGMLSGIAVEIEKVERSLRQMESQMEKGFKSDEDVKSFVKLMEQTENAIFSVHKGLKDVANVSLDDGAKELAKEIERINKKIEETQKNLKSTLEKSIKGSSLPQETKDYLKTLVQQNKLEKENFEQAKKNLQKQIDKYRQLYIAKKDQIKIDEQAKALKKTYSSINLFGKDGIKDEDLILSKKYGAASGATEGWRVRAQTGAGNIRPTTKVGNFTEIINKSYIDILKQATKEEWNAEKAMEALLQRFKEFGIITEGGSIQSNDSLMGAIRTKIGIDMSSISGAKRLEGIDLSKIIEANKELKDLKALIESWKDGKGSATIDEFFQQVVKSGERVNSLQQMISEATKKSAESTAAIVQANNALDAESTNIGNATNQWEAYRQQLIETSEQQKQIDSGFTQIINRLKYFFSIGTVFRYVRKEITQTYEDVKNLDKSFAEIAMVTKYSVNDMWKSYDQYAEMANRLGQATNDVIKASALYYQQGKPQAV